MANDCKCEPASSSSLTSLAGQIRRRPLVVSDGLKLGCLYRVPMHGAVSVMLRPSNVVVFFALLNIDEGWTLRSVADRLGVKHSKVQRAV